METKINQRLREIIDLHFDPQYGSPYWLAKEKQLRLHARRDIHTVQDLALLGSMDSHVLAEKPIEYFIPASQLSRRKNFILAETGGTLGKPCYAVYHQTEFYDAFILPFLVAAQRVNFPQEKNWLFIGPTGPHIIGKAARECARAWQSPDPFMVDFDPRWAKKMVEGSFSARRYLQHIEEQSLRILGTQTIEVLFSTPPVLDSLGKTLPDQLRNRIVGLHLGGMAVTTNFREALQQWFPQAVILSGYGNTLFGMAPEFRYDSHDGIDYYPHGIRLAFQVIDLNQDGLSDFQRLQTQVNFGQRGQVVFHRFDKTQFIANMMERDTAIRLPSSSESQRDGFWCEGLRDPRPLRTEIIKPALGLY